MIRTWRSSPRRKVGSEAGCRTSGRAVAGGMDRLAIWLVSRAEVGADGKTGYERCKGKMAMLPGMKFGEGVMWKRRRQGRPLGKLSCIWEDGIYLWVKGTTGEVIVGDRKEV